MNKYRTHNCGELRTENIGATVTLSGWVQTVRDKGHMGWILLRDRFGETQLFFEEGKTDASIVDLSRKLGREFVVTVTGKVIERVSKNPNMPTGDIEIAMESLTILNSSKTPPFTIEEESDGGDELRMQYRYLDLRRKPMQNNLIMRHHLLQKVRNYLSEKGFLEVETPFLIKSTPEGARDFVVPSRVHQGQFYALPQSPQTFKQLLMVSGFDRYFQIVKCFRDEDLRADRQPEFTQIDCELSFVDEADIMEIFSEMTRVIFRDLKGVELGEIPVMTYENAMKYYGSDKPDLRFDMKFHYLNDLAEGIAFQPFEEALAAKGSIVAVAAPNASDYSRKQLDELTEFVKNPRYGMKGVIWMKVDGQENKSSADKFFTQEMKHSWIERLNAKQGDLVLILAGATAKVQLAMGDLRLEMANKLGLKNKDIFKPLWVVDFPLVEWNEEQNRFDSLHHPFTAPKAEDVDTMDSGHAKSKAYDMVINGTEIGGGSIRIHDNDTQKKIFQLLGMTDEEAYSKFGFLLDALQFGAPPHGGIAFGFDRLCSILLGKESIRDVIAFPKNNAARDTMLDAPSRIDDTQLKELHLKTVD